MSEICLLKQKEIDVAKHISKAALDGCQCEPCLAAKKLTEEHDRELLATRFESWIPSAENINSLPSSIRKYVHDLETRCDPSGDTQTIAILTENVKALENLREECAQRLDVLANQLMLMTPYIRHKNTGDMGTRETAVRCSEMAIREAREFAAAIRSHTHPKEGQ